METIRLIDYWVTRAFGWIEIATLMVLFVFCLKAMGQAPTIQPLRKHVVYNYDSEIRRNRADEDSRELATLATEVEDLKTKVDALKTVETEGRISRLEGTLDTVKQLLIAIATAVGLMLMESVHRIFGSRLVPKEKQTEAA